MKKFTDANHRPRRGQKLLIGGTAVLTAASLWYRGDEPASTLQLSRPSAAESQDAEQNTSLENSSEQARALDSLAELAKPVSLRLPAARVEGEHREVDTSKALVPEVVDTSLPAVVLLRKATLGSVSEIRPQFDRIAGTPQKIARELSQSVRKHDEILAIQLSYGLRSAGRELAAEGADAAAKNILKGSRAERILATECAGIIGIETPLLAQAFRSAAGDSDSRLRYRTAAAIGRIEKPSDSMVLVLDGLASDQEELVSSRVEYSVAALKSADPEFVNKWTPPSGTPTTARASLKRVDAESRKSFQLSDEGLLTKLRRGDSRNRATAAMIAAVRDSSDPELIAALEANLGDTDERVRFASSYALGQIGLPAFAALVRGLKSEHVLVRVNIVQALKQMQPQSEEIRRALKIELRDSSADVRLQAALAFVSLGYFDEAASDVLVQVLGVNYGAVKAVAPAIAKVDMKPWVPRFEQGLDSEDSRTRIGAARALGLSAGAALGSVEKLQRAADDSDRAVRTAAQEALAAIRR